MKKVLNFLIVFCLVAFVLYFIKREDRVVVEEVEKIVISVKDRDLIVELEKNSSAHAFYERLKKESITIKTTDNNDFEKVGNLGFELPRNDETIETKPGDLILYQGNKIALYYNTNKYKFTKLGRVTNLDAIELRELLGDGDLTMKFSIKR